MKCRSLGDGFNLISNDQWMTVATDIANEGSNWSGSSVGTGALNRGHSDNSPSSSLAASTDSDACSGTGQSCSNISWDSQKRTHTLSNGEVIWDMAGNLNEWTSYFIADNSDKPNGSGGSGYSEYNTVIGTPSMAITELISNPSWTSTQGVGRYYRGNQNVDGALARGGDWNDGDSSGIFYASLTISPNDGFNGLGFRCVRQ